MGRLVADAAALALALALGAAEATAVAEAVAVVLGLAVAEPDAAVEEDGAVIGPAPVMASDGDLVAGLSSLHEAQTAPLETIAAPSAYCAARDNPDGIATLDRTRMSPSQKGQRLSVACTCRKHPSQTTSRAMVEPLAARLPHIDSRISEMPWPPPMHIVTRP